MPEISAGTQEEKDSFQSVQSVEIATQIMVHTKWTSRAAPSLIRSMASGTKGGNNVIYMYLYM